MREKEKSIDDSVRKYEKEFFKEQKIECLKDLFDVYKDIDGVYKFEPICPEYYKDLTKYLNARVKSYENYYSFSFLSFSFLYPKEKEEADDRKIALIESGNPLLLLTSDTFGFSVTANKRYPYGMLEDNDVNIAKKCIEDTRTLGGAFIWPVNMVWNKGKWRGTRINVVNSERGKHCYEDRVDLMLWEIKEYIDKKEEKDCLSIALIRDIWLTNWLGLFNSFENYVDFFMFHPFVVKLKEGEYYLIDIINSEIPEVCDEIGEKDDIKTPDERKPCLKVINKAPKTKEIQDCKVKQMLNNVRLLTLARSRMMTAFINDPDKDYWKEYDPKWTEEDVIPEEMNPPSES